MAMQAHATDLLQAYRDAQVYDSQFAGALASREANREKSAQGLAGLLPQVAITGNSNRIEGSSSGTAFPGQSRDIGYTSTTMQLQLQQPIYRPVNFNNYEQSKLQVAAGELQFEQAKIDLALRVAQAYFDVLAAQDALIFINAQKLAITEQLASAKRNFEVGTATITDTHEAQARFDLATSQEIAAKSDLDVKQRALELLIGKAAPVLAPLSARLQLTPPEPAVLDKWVEEARSVNPQVRAAEYGLTLAQQEVVRNRGAHYPTLDAFAGVTRNASGVGTLGGPGTDINNRNIGLQLALPIYQGGLVDSRVREAVANEEKARQDLESARRGVELQTRQNYVGVTSGIAQVRALEAALTSSQSALDSTRLGREVGVRTQVDVLNAQQQLFSARRDLAQAKYNYIMSTLKLKASVGRLTEADVVAVNAWLERKP